MIQARLLPALVCSLAFAVAAAPAPAAQLLDRIVAVVNDEVVLASELKAEMALVRNRLERNDRRVPPRDVLRERVLEQLILERIQLQRADRRGIRVDDQAVENALRNMAARNGLSLAQLRARVNAGSIGFDKLRENVRESLIISKLRQREVGSRIRISEHEIDAALQRMKQASRKHTQYRLSHILISVPADASSEAVAAARQRARAVARRLREGADFARLAARVSDGPRALKGGDLGWRSAASLPDLFLEAVRQMEPGEISQPLRSPNGFHILRLVARRGGVRRSVTQFRVRHIVLRSDEAGAAIGGVSNVSDTGNESGAAHTRSPRERLEELRRRLLSGADFATLARAYSEDPRSARRGGKLGWVGPGERSRVFMQVLRTLQPGAVSEPFRTPTGWHLVKLLEKRTRQNLEQYRRARARRALYRRELTRRAQRWRQRLRDKAYVDIRLQG